ncbi:MAG: phytanoyl-CoA dioxygenase family protein, partial [Bdellovibrionales bacterium]
MKKIIGVIKKLINQPRLVYYYIQKSIRVPFLRSSLAKLISILNPPAKNIELTQATQCYNELESVGFSFTKGILTPEQVQDIKKYLLPLECTEIRTSGRTTCRVSEGVPASCRKLFYDAKTLTSCPHVLELANNPMLLATAEKHLGCRPTVSFITAWWSFPGVPEPGEQVYHDDMYHRDVEDYSFLKLFVYLTDVGDENGP